MYYAHFGLKEPPFKITPNTEFFFSGANRGAVLDALKYAIGSGEGIVKVVGEVGSGKTMLCRMLQNDLPEKVESIYLANPSVAPEDVLHAIAFELQLELPQQADRLKVMQLLQEHLLRRYAEGKQVVIFVEEAQGMPIETLEEIRLLSNLETKQDKLLQIVLFGQPELDENLNQNKIRQLKERITHSFYLAPFDKKDIGTYVDFRLRKAGYSGPPIFTPYALKILSHASEGLVRRANILADKALLATFSENVYQVTHKHVIAAIRDSEFGREKVNGNHVKRGLYWLTAVLLLASIAAAAYFFVRYQQSLTPAMPVAQTPMSAIKPAPVAKAKVTEVIKVPETLLVTPPEAVVEAKVKPVEAVPNTSSNIPAPSVAPQPVKVAAPPAIPPSPDDLLTSKLMLTQKWLAEQPETTNTIQMMGAASDEQLREQLKQIKGSVDIEQVYVYRTLVGGNPFITVTYGSYPTKAEAVLAMQQLPKALKAYGPHARTVGGILKETKQLQ